MQRRSSGAYIVLVLALHSCASSAVSSQDSMSLGLLRARELSHSCSPAHAYPQASTPPYNIVAVNTRIVVERSRIRNSHGVHHDLRGVGALGRIAFELAEGFVNLSLRASLSNMNGHLATDSMDGLWVEVAGELKQTDEIQRTGVVVRALVRAAGALGVVVDANGPDAMVWTHVATDRSFSGRLSLPLETLCVANLVYVRRMLGKCGNATLPQISAVGLSVRAHACVERDDLLGRTCVDASLSLQGATAARARAFPISVRHAALYPHTEHPSITLKLSSESNLESCVQVIYESLLPRGIELQLPSRFPPKARIVTPSGKGSATLLWVIADLCPGAHVEVTLPVQRKFVHTEDLPYDPSRGFVVGGARVWARDAMEETEHFALRGYILDREIVDQSMPYNVIMLTSTAVAIVFGALLHTHVRGYLNELR